MIFGRIRSGKDAAHVEPAPVRFQKPLPIAEITPEAVRERLCWRLSRMIGPKRRWSITEAARLTGINARTMRAYVEGRACPNLARYSRLLRVFGPEVGIEMALILGWEPRAMRGTPPGEILLRELRDGVVQALTAVDHAIAAGGQRLSWVDYPAPPSGPAGRR